MAKTKETKLIENALCREYHRQYGCLEVSIGIGSRIKERVDFMVFDHYKGVFKCFEIKVSKADFYSKACKSFVGHHNYYVMPVGLYLEVGNDIPDDIGVYVARISRQRDLAWLESAKKCRRKELTAEEIDNLKDSLIRSLSRDANKLYMSEDEPILQQYQRENTRLHRDNSQLAKRNSSLMWENRKMSNFLEEKYGGEFVKKLLAGEGWE